MTHLHIPHYNNIVVLTVSILINLLINDAKAESTPATTGQLSITISNINNDNLGHPIYIALHQLNIQATWTDPPFLSRKIIPEVILYELNVDNLPYGNYAIRLFQDINNNGNLDLNQKDNPLEPFGFSNIKKIRREPNINRAAFNINQDSSHITVFMHRPRRK